MGCCVYCEWGLLACFRFDVAWLVGYVWLLEILGSIGTGGEGELSELVILIRCYTWF